MLIVAAVGAARRGAVGLRNASTGLATNSPTFWGSASLGLALDPVTLVRIYGPDEALLQSSGRVGNWANAS